MDINEFKSRIKNGTPEGWYIISGEEDYLKKYYMKSLKDSVIPENDPFAAFNYISFDGDDIDFAAVGEALKSPPMMSEYKLIEWKFANLDALKEGEKCALEELFELKSLYPYAVFSIMTVVSGFDLGSVKKPSKLALRLSRGFDILNFDKSTDSQLISWLKKHFDRDGVGADLQTLSAMLFRCGHSMEVLNSETSKLTAYAKARGLSSVGISDVEAVCSSTPECDAFALSNSVIDRDINKAFAALTDLKQRRIEPAAVMGMLERTYSELSSVALLLDEGCDSADISAILKSHPYKTSLYIKSAKKIGTKRLAAALSELARIDASSKSGGLGGYGVIEMFITQNI